MEKTIKKSKKVKNNKDRFYKWLIKIGNIHIGDNNQMCNAYNKIIEY